MDKHVVALYLLTLGWIAVAGNFNNCHSQPCRRYLGVYYFIVPLNSNLTLYEVATFYEDGSFDTIDSLADGNQYSTTPSFGSYSNLKGVWNCTGQQTIAVNVIEFNYPSPTVPVRYVSKAMYNITFGANETVTGTISYRDYTLSSTQNSNQSKWTQFFGPINYNLTGYKLFTRCEN